jgi:hypothetical protein
MNNPTMNKYEDFQLPDFDGVFRTVNADIDDVVNHILINYSLFKTISDGYFRWYNCSMSRIYKNDVGQSWTETKHPTLANSGRHCIQAAVSWRTTLDDENDQNAHQLEQLFTVKKVGIKLMYCDDPNSPPSLVCWFFPFDEHAEEF